MMKLAIHIPFGTLAILELCGCGTGQETVVGVAHSPLDPVETVREGRILVSPFTDNRPKSEQQSGRIGSKHPSTGFEFGPCDYFRLPEEQEVAAIVSEFFADALIHVGYDVAIKTAPSNGVDRNPTAGPVITGNINRFSLDEATSYRRIGFRLDIDVILENADDREILWKRTFKTKRHWKGHSFPVSIRWLDSDGSDITLRADFKDTDRTKEWFLSNATWLEMDGNRVPIDSLNFDEPSSEWISRELWRMLTTTVEMQVSRVLDEILNEAASAFASEEFYKLVTMQQLFDLQ